MLDGLPGTSPGEPLKVYSYSSYPFFRYHSAWYHTSLLGLSLTKYFEVYFLFHRSGALAILSAAPFTFFFFAAICLEIHEIGSSRHSMKTDGQLDIVTGLFPSVKQLGGSRKVVLGSTKNVRNSVWWKIIWTIGAALYSVSLLISYVLLGQQTTEVVITWAIFQVAWLVLRIVISHIKEFSEPTGNRPIIGNEINVLPLPMKLRVANLIFAVAIFLADLHPRGLSAYTNDSYSTSQIARMLAGHNSCEVYVLPQEETLSVQLNVRAIIGDVTLSSAAWILGSTFTAMDLYDSCIIVLDSPLSQGQPQSFISIPAVRVMTAKATFQIGINGSEKAEPLFVPRAMGGGSEVRNPEWMYLIPCRSGHWLQFKSTDMLSLGKRTAEVVGDSQLTRILSTGNLHISLKNSLEVKDIIDISRKAAKLLVSLLN